MENQDSSSKWKEYTGKIPDPRPGTVNSNTRSHTQLLPLSSAEKKHVTLYFGLQGLTPEN